VIIRAEAEPLVSSSTTEEEVILTRLIEKAIRRSEAVDREALCVIAGEKVGFDSSSSSSINMLISLSFSLLYKVWHIRLHLHILSSDGNLIDAGCLAGMTALRHFRRPEVERIEREGGGEAVWKVVSVFKNWVGHSFQADSTCHPVSYG
jgi:exosome complex component RRP45